MSNLLFNVINVWIVYVNPSPSVITVNAWTINTLVIVWTSCTWPSICYNYIFYLCSVVPVQSLPCSQSLWYYYSSSWMWVCARFILLRHGLNENLISYQSLCVPAFVVDVIERVCSISSSLTCFRRPFIGYSASMRRMSVPIAIGLQWVVRKFSQSSLIGWEAI